MGHFQVLLLQLVCTWGGDGNEGVFRIPQSPSINNGASASNCLISYPGYSLWGFLPLCRDAVGVSYSPSRLGWFILFIFIIFVFFVNVMIMHSLTRIQLATRIFPQTMHYYRHQLVTRISPPKLSITTGIN